MNGVLLLFWLLCGSARALEDITDEATMGMQTAQTFVGGENNQVRNLFEDEIIIGPDPRDLALKLGQSSAQRHAPQRAIIKFTTRFPTTLPPDNFGKPYQEMNKTMFMQTSTNLKPSLNLTRPLPPYAFSNDSSSQRDKQSTTPNYFRTTTHEPEFWTAKQRDHKLIQKVPLAESSEFDVPFSTLTDEFDVVDSTPPPAPPPDWAVNHMLIPEPSASENEITEEPFKVTTELENLFDLATEPTSTTRDSHFGSTAEVPTMKMYPWEMQRGDINVETMGKTAPTANPTFTPVSVRTPKTDPKASTNVLIPQEEPTDVDLPKVYTILPRLVLPQRPEAGPRGPPLPSAPPTLMAGAGRARTLGPPSTMASFRPSAGDSDLFPFAKARHGPPAVGLTADPFLVASTPRPQLILFPAAEAEDGAQPPGIPFSSRPPGFAPQGLASASSPTPTLSSTPYYTEVLLPKQGKTTLSQLKEYGPDLKERVETTTAKFIKFEKQAGTKIVAKPKIQNSYFSSVQDKSQLILSDLDHQQLKLVRPSVKHRKHFDPANQASTLSIPSTAAVFNIPRPIKLSMSTAVRVKPFMVSMPRNRLDRLHHYHQLHHHHDHLHFAQFTHKPPPIGFFRKTQQADPTVSIPDVHPEPQPQGAFNGQLSWVPAGLGPPSRLGPVKLVPSKVNTNKIELNAFKDDEVKLDLCQADLFDDLTDLKGENRDFVRKCFRRVRNCLLMDAVPLERRINYSEEQCVNFCGHHPYCQSAAYSSSLSVCDIFEKKNGTGPIRTVNYLGTNYYEAKNPVAIGCWKAGLKESFFTKAPLPSILIDSADSTSAEMADPPRRQDLINSKSTVVVAPKDVCTKDQDVILLKSTGYKTRNFGVVPLPQNSSETECVFSCLVNLARDHIPYECQSAAFGRNEGCLIYKSGSNTKGNGHLIPESGYTHYEKACVSSRLVELCKGYPIVRLPQHVLLGSTKATTKANSLTDCLEICLDDYRISGECKSIMFFYEEREDNCVLNVESERTESDFFVEESDTLVDYASFDKCLDNVDYHNVQQTSMVARHRLARLGAAHCRGGECRRARLRQSTSASLPPASRKTFFAVGSTDNMASARTKHHLPPDPPHIHSNHAPQARPFWHDEQLLPPEMGEWRRRPARRRG